MTATDTDLNFAPAAEQPIAYIARTHQWYGALGYGNPSEIPAASALDIARNSTPASIDLPADGDPTGLKAGATVTVTPDDVGRDPVEGVLVGANHGEVVIRRTDPRAGVVHLHFPRAGYDVMAA